MFNVFRAHQTHKKGRASAEQPDRGNVTLIWAQPLRDETPYLARASYVQFVNAYNVTAYTEAVNGRWVQVQLGAPDFV